MLSRLWTSIRYGIAAKLYLMTAVSLAALLILAAASIHFANQTKLAAERLYSEGVMGIQAVTQLEVLFEQHRALITAAPAELDRNRLKKSRQAVDAVNVLIEANVLAHPLEAGTPKGKLLAELAAQVPYLKDAGYRVLMLADSFAQDKALE